MFKRYIQEFICKLSLLAVIQLLYIFAPVHECNIQDLLHSVQHLLGVFFLL